MSIYKGRYANIGSTKELADARLRRDIDKAFALANPYVPSPSPTAYPSRLTTKSSNNARKVSPSWGDDACVDIGDEDYIDQLDLPFEDISEQFKRYTDVIKRFNQRWQCLAIDALNWQRLMEDISRDSQLEQQWNNLLMFRKIKNRNPIYEIEDLEDDTKDLV